MIESMQPLMVMQAEAAGAVFISTLGLIFKMNFGIAFVVGILMNMSILGWAANEWWGWFEWELLNNIYAAVQ